MKKVFCAFLVIILSFVLCCCKTEETKAENVRGEPLSDGTKTYYINETDKDGQKVHSTRYTENNKKIEEYAYSYSYDLNGRLCKITETDVDSGIYTETVFDKFKNKTEKITYSKKGEITDKKDYLKNGCVKKSYIFKNGKETGYILYDYYSDNQIKNETEYSVNGKTVKIKTYYKNKQIYQIKDFDSDGMIEKITKYTYKGDTIVKESQYDSEFNLSKVIDYTENPPVVTEYGEKEKAES